MAVEAGLLCQDDGEDAGAAAQVDAGLFAAVVGFVLGQVVPEQVEVLLGGRRPHAVHGVDLFRGEAVDLNALILETFGTNESLDYWDWHEKIVLL